MLSEKQVTQPLLGETGECRPCASQNRGLTHRLQIAIRVPGVAAVTADHDLDLFYGNFHVRISFRDHASSSRRRG